MRVLDSFGDGTAVCVDPELATHTVSVELLDAAVPGDRVLVHAGFAVAVLASDATQTGESVAETPARRAAP